jgi:phospholipid-binding lipoprotein MlaA
MKKLISSLILVSLFTSWSNAFATPVSSAPIIEQEPAATTTTLSDPLETYNRNAYQLNDKLDKTIVRPVTVWYVSYIPQPFRLAVGNFYNNLRDFVTLGNDILQLNGMASMQNMMRISINTIVGLGGLIDVSSSLGLLRHKNSFGNTLKVYGWKQSSYFVIPLLGPSTVRDTIGLIPDLYFNPTWYVIPDKYEYVSVGLFTVNGIDTRSHYLDYDQLLQTSLDPYITMRDAYLQAIGELAPTSNSNEDVSIDELLDNSVESSSTYRQPTPSENKPTASASTTSLSASSALARDTSSSSLQD